MPNWGEPVISLQNLVWLGIQLGIVGFVQVMADAVFLAPGDTQFDLQAHLQGHHALQIIGADGEVVLQRLLGQIQHVRGIKRLAVGFVVSFALGDQTIDPGEQLAVGVIGVQDHADTIIFGQQMHMLGGRDGAHDLGRITIRHALAGKKLRPTVGKLNNDVRFVARRRLQYRVHGICTHDVHRRQGIGAALARRQQCLIIIAVHHAWFHPRHRPFFSHYFPFRAAVLVSIPRADTKVR